MQIGMPQAIALKSIGYTDAILFLTIGKPDIYKHKSVGKSATVFYPDDQKLPKLAADFPNHFCEDIRLTDIRDCTFTALPIVGKSTVSVYSTEFRCICKRHSYSICTGNR
jgi:hypothetical protein